MKVIIVGGVAGGMSAATRLRRLDEHAEIIVLDKGAYVSFANCGLPYHVSGEIAEREALLLNTPEGLKERFNLDVRVNSEVLKIERDAKQVIVQTPSTQYMESYDVLLLSPGAVVFQPDIPGINAKNVFSLRSVEQLDQVMHFLKTQEPQQAVVVGAGFIGLEVVENLIKKGLKVTLIEKEQHVLPPADKEMAAFVTKELINKGVVVRVGAAISKIVDEGKQVELTDGTLVPSDMIILAIGVTPNTQIAKEAGLALGERDGIVVNEHYQTSDSNIYAVGDAILVNNQLTKRAELIALASPANRQGRQVADVIAGQLRINQGSIKTAIVRAFDLTIAMTGLNEKQLQQASLAYQVVHTRGWDHASYYPGATPLLLKLLYHPTKGILYGAQAVGEKGVSKRIDVLATAIKGQLQVADLPELELTYAPPFGVAKDPVNMLGYVALNQMEGLSETVQWYELSEKMADGAELIDVRKPEELLEHGYIKGSRNIPLDNLREHLSELSPNSVYIVSCASGQRSYLAERIMKQAGLRVSNLDGAFSLYQLMKPEEIEVK